MDHGKKGLRTGGKGKEIMVLHPARWKEENGLDTIPRGEIFGPFGRFSMELFVNDSVLYDHR